MFCYFTREWNFKNLNNGRMWKWAIGHQASGALISKLVLSKSEGFRPGVVPQLYLGSKVFKLISSHSLGEAANQVHRVYLYWLWSGALKMVGDGRPTWLPWKWSCRWVERWRNPSQPWLWMMSFRSLYPSSYAWLNLSSPWVCRQICNAYDFNPGFGNLMIVFYGAAADPDCAD